MSLSRPAPPGRLALLAARRETLVALGRAQRQVIGLRWHAVKPSLRGVAWVGWVGRGWSAWHWVRRHRRSVIVCAATLATLTALTSANAPTVPTRAARFRSPWTARLLAGALAAARVARWLR